jgi:nitrogen fixation NifU-like protein
MEFWVDSEAGRVARASYITDGCGSSRACGDMAATLSEGRLLDDASTLGQVDILDALGGLPAEMEHCALLASLTLRAALRSCLQSQVEAGGGEHFKSQAQEDAT